LVIAGTFVFNWKPDPGSWIFECWGANVAAGFL
jgi:hypothetical protein